ncbi:coupling protein TraD (plasmid) [Calothrix sp. NIES-4101]|nr:coupling protein TraD [Calothrix sp. NIES-4101]
MIKTFLNSLFQKNTSYGSLRENIFTVSSQKLGRRTAKESCKEPICYAGKEVSRSSLDTNVLSIGSPGSGKTMLLKMTCHSTLKLCKKGSGIKVIILDTKGDLLPVANALTKANNVPLYYINQGDNRSITPSDGVTGYAWHIAKDCEGKENFIEEKLSIIFPIAKSEPMWQQAAQLLASASIVDELDWQLATIYYFFFSGTKFMREVLDKTDFGRAVKELLIDSDAEKTTAGIKINAASSIKRFKSAAAHQYHTPRDRWLSLKDFINGSEGVLVIGRDSSTPEVSNPLIQAMFKSLVDYIKMRPEVKEKDIFVFIDELPAFDKLSGLTDMLTFERSKGVSVYMTTQSIEALQEIYGDKATDTIASTCGIKIIGLLTSCTWKYECQNHDYVQGELAVEYQVKEDTQLYVEK